MNAPAVHHPDCPIDDCRTCWEVDIRQAENRGDENRVAQLEREGRDNGWCF